MKFSIATQSFYAPDLQFGASIPVDAIEIEQSVADELFQAINNGAHVYADSGVLKASEPRPDKYHSWDEAANIWTITDAAIEQKLQDEVELVEQQKSALRQTADAEIDWRQDALDFGIATEEEAAELAAWKTYRVMLMRVDLAEPDWPTPPGKQAS
ncbi:tail fiber assembly protein [Escherichia coli]|uniref:tail fiber assembly protein n=1 Tax=Escherichia coli TaxID=562 RepID=UPI000DF10FA7|nr:tail fiber assembly protein [Escherichia coli]HBM9594745.1 tail fiber assembly protein [Escherichia coli]